MIYLIDGNFVKDRSSIANKPRCLLVRENHVSKSDRKNIAPSPLIVKLRRMQAKLAKRGLMGQNSSLWV